MSVTNCINRAPSQDFRNGLWSPFRSKSCGTSSTCSSGFTLIELLVVTATVAILAAVLFPVMFRAKESARQTRCLSNLKQIVAAWQLYADDNGTRVCPSYYFASDGTMYSWDFTFVPTSTWKPGLLAPYTKSGALYSCPSFKAAGGRPYTGYAYNASYIGGDPVNTPPCRTEPCFLGQIARQSAKVVFADGGYGRPVKPHNYLRAPSDPLFLAGGVHFRHAGFASAAYADGHVRASDDNELPDPSSPECGALSKDDSAYNLQ